MYKVEKAEWKIGICYVKIRLEPSPSKPWIVDVVRSALAIAASPLAANLLSAAVFHRCSADWIQMDGDSCVPHPRLMALIHWPLAVRVGCRELPRFFRCSAGDNQNKFVITSYSIHYTKLYEGCPCQEPYPVSRQLEQKFLTSMEYPSQKTASN